MSVLRPGEIEPHSGQHFDGIMTRLHGDPGFRIEADLHSGRQQLHVSLAETSFFAFRLTQWLANNPRRTRPDHAFQSRLFSVNLLLIDDADRVLLIRRADAITHGGLFAGAVSGAIEVVDREGIAADLDTYGLPDPMATLIREAREELGVDISQPQNKLGVIGLIEVMAPIDMHTHVLTATARIEGDATAFRIVTGLADDIEGAWEVGKEAMVIDLRTALSSPMALQNFVDWRRGAPELLPHAVGGILLLLRARVQSAADTIRQAGGVTDDLILAALATPALVAKQRPPSVTVRALRTE